MMLVGRALVRSILTLTRPSKMISVTASKGMKCLAFKSRKSRGFWLKDISIFPGREWLRVFEQERKRHQEPVVGAETREIQMDKQAHIFNTEDDYLLQNITPLNYTIWPFSVPIYLCLMNQGKWFIPHLLVFSNEVRFHSGRDAQTNTC